MKAQVFLDPKPYIFFLLINKLEQRKKIYFASDFHLGAPNHEQSLIREKIILKWLNQVKHDAQEIILLGDIFDFWFEYKHVVPKGFVRLLSAIAQLQEKGISISVFTGKHDIWMFDYLEKELGVKVGYSDHTLGIEVPIAAVAYGATVIEKHFTLDRTMEGPDHAASLEPDELKQMISSIRNIEKAMGDGQKKPSRSERDNIRIVRKSIVASKKINAGEKFTEENLVVKRPGTGISPLRWDELLGLEASKDFQADELISI